MKRAKIMLTAIAVLAVVGGALAFKANKKFITNYCILTTFNNPQGGTCTGEFLLSKPGGTTGSYWYTTKNIGDVCTNKPCVVLTTTFIKE